MLDSSTDDSDEDIPLAQRAIAKAPPPQPAAAPVMVEAEVLAD